MEALEKGEEAAEEDSDEESEDDDDEAPGENEFHNFVAHTLTLTWGS